MVAPLAFAGSFLNDEYILSKNVPDLEKRSGIFLTLNLEMDWTFRQTNPETNKTRVEHNRMVNAVST